MVWCDLFFFRGVIVLAGRVREACLEGKAPAPEALFSVRQGERSLLGRGGSCPGSSILDPAGWEKLVWRERHLPKKLYSRSGRVRIACKDTLNVAICLKATANINLSPLRWERRTRSCFKMGVIRN